MGHVRGGTFKKWKVLRVGHVKCGTCKGRDM